MIRRHVVACVLLAASVAAHAQSPIALACHGLLTSQMGNGKTEVSQLVFRARIDVAEQKIALYHVSCWAGRGDCTALAVSMGENTISAYGDGTLRNTGRTTSIEIDRRSGFMRFSQGFLRRPENYEPHLAWQESGEFVCQGGSAWRF